jgi:hypothetical protein
MAVVKCTRIALNSRSGNEVGVSNAIITGPNCDQREFSCGFGLLGYQSPIAISPSSPLSVKRLVLRNLADTLRLLVSHLDGRDLVAIGNAAGHLLTSGLDFL